MATNTKDQESERTAQQDESSNPLQALQSSPTVQAAVDSPVVQQGVNPLIAFFKKFSNDWTMNIQAGALAYNLLIALFPIIIALLSILGLVLGNMAPSVQQQLIQGLSQALPQQQGVSSAVIEQVISKLSQSSGVLGILAIVTTAFGGSRLFIMIENCFALIYRLPPRKALRQNMTAIGMLLIFVILIPIMVVASSGPALLLSLVQNTPLAPTPLTTFLLRYGGIAASIFVSWIFFEAIYLVIPNQRIRFRDSWRGAVVAAFALQLYLLLFPYYTTRFLGGYGGQAGFAIILLVFFYYFAIILLLGAQVNAFYGQKIPETEDNLALILHKLTTKDGQEKDEARQQAEQKEAGPAPKDAEPAQHTRFSLPFRKKKDTSSHEEHARPQKTSRLSSFAVAAAGTAFAFAVQLSNLRHKQ